MCNLSYLILAVCLISAFIILFVCKKTGFCLKNLFLSSVSGLGSLFLLNMLTDFTAVSVSINYLSLAISTFFGIPGVIGLVVSQILI